VQQISVNRQSEKKRFGRQRRANRPNRCMDSVTIVTSSHKERRRLAATRQGSAGDGAKCKLGETTRVAARLIFFFEKPGVITNPVKD
jgi:hypothetical protein